MGKDDKRAYVVPIERIWLTTKDCMDYLGVSRGFIDDLRERGELRFHKVGHTVFVRKADIDRLIEKSRVV